MLNVETEQNDNLRFTFGKNWNNFLKVLDEERIIKAENSLLSMFGEKDLNGKSFLDIGSGSGLFSLAAARLGARKIHSFDYDTHSVACTNELKRRYYPKFDNWKIEKASVLDQKYLTSLGQFDVVYSWGVLHHTGEMWQALANTIPVISKRGLLFISIYNDQGIASNLWTKIKLFYNRLPAWIRPIYTLIVWLPFEILPSIKQVFTGHTPWHHWTTYKKERGMSRIHDIVDWVGGYPFEVATPEKIFTFFKKRNLSLEGLITRQGTGCNEFLFRKKD